MIGGMEWVVVLIVVAIILFFGPSKLPALFRSLGRAMGEFRKARLEVEREVREMETEAKQLEVEIRKQ
jgi:sec-independent protein translocase protein TatA